MPAGVEYYAIRKGAPEDKELSYSFWNYGQYKVEADLLRALQHTFGEGNVTQSGSKFYETSTGELIGEVKSGDGFRS